MGFSLVDEPEPLTLLGEKSKAGDALTWGKQEQESETDQVITLTYSHYYSSYIHTYIHTYILKHYHFIPVYSRYFPVFLVAERLCIAWHGGGGVGPDHRTSERHGQRCAQVQHRESH